MKKYICATIVFACTTVTGCGPENVKTNSSFDAGQAAAMLNKGNATIKGSGLIRQNGGGVVTCAGSEVQMIPATEYAKERIAAIYGNTNRGHKELGLFTRATKFENEPAAYRQDMRTTNCDAQGTFVFHDVAKGEFFLVTVITWMVGNYNRQGGAIMQRVSISDDETKEIVLAP